MDSGDLKIDKVQQYSRLLTFYDLLARGLFDFGLFFDFPRDSSNVPEDCHRLPAQVGSLAPILGEVPSAYKAKKLDLDCNQGFEPRRLV